MRFFVRPQHPQERLLRQASYLLREDGTLIYPTDTTYGLGCDLYSKRGIDKLRLIKPMEAKHPLTLLCRDIAELSRYAILSDLAFQAIKRAVPGPYTFILPTTKLVSRTVVGKRGEAGFRIPDNRIALELIRVHGSPLLNTSVPTDMEVMQDPELLYQQYERRVDGLIDGGIVRNTPSAVLDLTGDEIVVVREAAGPSAFQPH